MLNFKILVLILLLVTVSCNNLNKNTKEKNGKKCNYSIVYMSRDQTYYLSVFDNENSIYLSDKLNSNINTFIKVQADKETIEDIKETITDHLNYKSLLVERNYAPHSGTLSISLSCDSKKIECIQPEVDKDLKVSKRIYNLINNLKLKHKEVEEVFK